MPNQMAADGSLWFWPLESVMPYYYDNNQRLDPLLDVSHKPRRLGNIFSPSAGAQALAPVRPVL